MALYTLSPAPFFQFLDNSGNPLSGGFVTTYLAGTLTAATTYQTSSGTAHTNPIELDSAGRTRIYLTPGVSYKFKLQTSALVLVRTDDNIASVPPSTVNFDFRGIAGVDLAAEDSVYLSTGLGGLNPGQWYKTDADIPYASSDAVTRGMVPESITAGNLGIIRAEGEMTVTGPLTPGAKYYASTAAGAITATAPTFAAFVGQAQSATSLVITPNRGGGGSELDILFIDCML